MACSSSPSLGLQHHGRSISLPSRLHPLSTKIELELNKLKTWEISVSANSPLTAETIQIGLVDLFNLYNCIDELIQSPLTQQALLQHQHGTLLEESLEVSIELLDSCGSLKDLVSTMKENVQDLQSALRRKGGDSSIGTDINKYNTFRKKVMKREISKSLRALKQTENKMEFSLLGLDYVLSMVIKVLRQVTVITISVFRSLLLLFSVSSSATQTRHRGWSLVSRLLTMKFSDSENSHKMINEVESDDLALQYLNVNFCRSDQTKVDVGMVRRRLQTLGGSIQGFETGLDCLYKRLIQSRVSLLNILAC